MLRCLHNAALVAFASFAAVSCGVDTASELKGTELKGSLGETVEFHIPAGTGKGAWNAKESAVRIKVGDVLRIVNDDAIVHAVHTAGAPCRHTPDIRPGASFDCIASQPYDSDRSGPLFDHYAGPRSSSFWVFVTK